MSLFGSCRSVGGVLLCLFATSAVFAEEGLKSVFDGKSLDGWKALPEKDTDGHWTVQDGVIIAENVNKKGSNLWTDKEYTDYEIELEYQTSSDYYDTGVMLRGNGHQVQLGISGSLKKDMSACVYAPKDKRGSYPGVSEKGTESLKLGEWNHLRIILTGKRIQTFHNGVPCVDYTGVAISDKGPIGLQLHGGHHMKIQFRNIKLKEL